MERWVHWEIRGGEVRKNYVPGDVRGGGDKGKVYEDVGKVV